MTTPHPDERQDAHVPPNLLEAWRRLLVNRSRPYALQQADGTYRWVQRTVTDEVLLAHLTGDATLALSSTDARGWCRWLCLDVDAPDTLPHLLVVCTALAAHGLPGLVEASRRGGHLWIFLDEEVPVAEARWTLLEVCERIRTAGIRMLPDYELYPTPSAAGTLGHPVRLPLGVHRLTGKRYPLFDAEGIPCAFTSPEAALRFVLDVPHVKARLVHRAWQRFVNAAPTTAPVSTQAMDTLQCTRSDDAIALDDAAPPDGRRLGTASAVIRWVDAHISPLDLLAEVAPETAPRRAGQGYLGWCPFHDDRAPDALGRSGTPSFYVVFNRRLGWSWRCFSTNCAHSHGPMRHAFRLWQELRHLDPSSAILAAVDRWPTSGGDALAGGTHHEPG